MGQRVCRHQLDKLQLRQQVGARPALKGLSVSLKEEDVTGLRVTRLNTMSVTARAAMLVFYGSVSVSCEVYNGVGKRARARA